MTGAFPDRVLILGPMGAGKTTLGRELAARTGVPFASVDAILFGAGWKRRRRAESHPELRAFVARQQWVLDNAGHDLLDERIAAATTIVMIDCSRTACFAGMLARFLAGRPTASGLPPRLTIWMLRSVWSWPCIGRPRMLSTIADCGAGAELVVVHSRNEAWRWLDAVAPRRGSVAFNPGRTPEGAA